MATPEPDEVSRERIRSRTSGEELFELLVEQAETFQSEEFKRRFWTLLAYRIAEHTGMISDEPVAANPGDSLPRQYRPMDEAESKRFGQTVITFGKKFIGRKVDEADLGNLRYIDEDEFRWKLHRYLKSNRVLNEER